MGFGYPTDHSKAQTETVPFMGAGPVSLIESVEDILLILLRYTYTVIAYSYDGIGISEEDQKNIFNRFYKADRSRAHEGDSFGLGLAMVRWIAEAHGGEISVESTLGQGSVFTVILPEA